MSFYLSIKEIWRTKSRFLLFGLVIALITVLVVFIAGLAEGLSASNKEYIEKLDADLIVFQENVDLSSLTSRIDGTMINALKRVESVEEIGPIGLGSATIVGMGDAGSVDVSLIGYEIGKPGGAPPFEGSELRRPRGFDTVIDSNVASRAGIEVGEEITLKTIQGTEDEFFTLKVVGISDGRLYFFQPSIFVSSQVWERIRPQPNTGRFGNTMTANIVALQLKEGTDLELAAQQIEREVDGVEIVDRVTAYEAAPGYSEQQGTLNTQRAFTLLIGVLVIGGFFQIQTLQKIPNIGMLKAIGASNRVIAQSVVLQIMAVTIFGVALGSLVTLLLSLGLPAGIPIRFTAASLGSAVLSLVIIGPIGGLVSVRMAIKVEPLVALGLSS